MNIGDGRQIKIKFTQPLIGDVSGLETPAGYKQAKVDLTGAVFTSGALYSSDYSAGKAFDGLTNTQWWGKPGVNWLKVKFPKPKKITSFRLNMGSYYIKTFTISGSNDDETWTQIGGTFTGASSITQQWYEYALENDESYLYYKLDSLTTESSSYALIYEWELLETVPHGNETKFAVSFDEYNHIPGGTLSRKTRAVESFEENKSFYKKANLEECSLNDLQLIKDAGALVLGFKEVVEGG